MNTEASLNMAIETMVNCWSTRVSRGYFSNFNRALVRWLWHWQNGASSRNVHSRPKNRQWWWHVLYSIQVTTDCVFYDIDMFTLAVYLMSLMISWLESCMSPIWYVWPTKNRKPQDEPKWGVFPVLSIMPVALRRYDFSRWSILISGGDIYIYLHRYIIMNYYH